MAQIPQVLPIPDQGWEIKYRGNVAEDASRLLTDLSAVGARIEAAVPVPEDDARLGGGEIILTIFASAAAKALIDLVGLQIRQYLAKRIGNSSEPLSLRVVLRSDPSSSGRQHVIDVRGATAALVDKFIANITDGVKKAVTP